MGYFEPFGGSDSALTLVELSLALT